MKWHKLSEEPIPEILSRTSSAIVIKRKDGAYPNKDGHITLSFICNEPLVMYSPDLDDIQPTVELITLLDSIKEIMNERDDLYDDDFTSVVELYERELEKSCVKFIKDSCK